MKFTTALVALPFAAVIAAPAFAGSMVEPTVEPEVVVVETFTPAWAGGYAGAQLGWGWSDTDTSGLDSNNDGFIDGTTNAIKGIGSSGNGGLGGLHAGYLGQYNKFVYGAEGDYDWADVALADDSSTMNGIGRLKAIAGYDLGRTMIYATAGGAYGDAKIAGNDFNDWGWLGGAGVKYQVNEKVTVGGEVLYQDWNEFSDSNVDVSVTSVTARVSYNF